jgi:replicative DNA helicase
MNQSLPIALEAERATLGSCLRNRDAIVTIAGLLTPDDFYIEQHAQIFDAILACYTARIPPDLRTVGEQLRKRGRLEAIGGTGALSALAADVPTSYHVEYYARAVQQASTLRNLIAAGGKIAAIGYDEQHDPEQALGDAQAVLNAVATRAVQPSFVPIGRVLDTLLEAIQADTPPGICTGLHDLDNLTGGLHGGDLLILAARPSVGKTALALTLARNIAQAGHLVPVFSLEMGGEQLVQRLVAMEAGIDLHRIRNRQIGEYELQAFARAAGQIDAWPLLIDDTPALTAAAIRARCLRLAADRGPVGLVVVDYLQLMGASDRYAGNRVQEVAEMSRGLKALARELGAPVLALSQLSRAVEGRQSKVPLLSDLRESGNLEQDADLVVFIHREEIYDSESDQKGVAELHIAKHRNGPIGVVPLRFDAQTTTFRNLAPTWRASEDAA